MKECSPWDLLYVGVKGQVPIKDNAKILYSGVGGTHSTRWVTVMRVWLLAPCCVSHPRRAGCIVRVLTLTLLRGFRGVALSSRSELQRAMERRKRVQSDQEEEGQSRTALEDVLLRRQQKQLEVPRLKYTSKLYILTISLYRITRSFHNKYKVSCLKGSNPS